MAKRKPVDTAERAIPASIDVAALQDLLPANQKFQFNEEMRIVNILLIEPAEILAQLQFSSNEWCVLIILCKCYPDYASYEELLACLTLLSLADCQTKILEAREAGSQKLSRELKPVRQAISSIRKKLRKLVPSLKISFIPDSGYGLTTTKPGKPDHEKAGSRKRP